jgi:hypothetical protein
MLINSAILKVFLFLVILLSSHKFFDERQSLGGFGLSCVLDCQVPVKPAQSLAKVDCFFPHCWNVHCFQQLGKFFLLCHPVISLQSCLKCLRTALLSVFLSLPLWLESLKAFSERCLLSL